MKKIHILSFLVFIGLLKTPIDAFSIEVKNLFKASVAVVTQRQTERNKAMEQGFSQVLVRVSGNKSILEKPYILDALQNAQQYVLGFSYGKYQAPTAVQTVPVFNYALNLKFDGMAIHRLLRKAELPVWGVDRPSLIVWWVVDKGDRQIVNFETSPEISAIISQQTSLRGIPTIFPMLDLQDNVSLEARDIWGFFFDKIKDASVRYGSRNILVGRSSAQGEQSESRWVLLSENDISWGEKTNGELATVLPESIEFAANILAERYAISSVSGSGSNQVITIYGINDLSQFADVERIFQQLDIVEHVNLIGIEQDYAVFQLSIRTELERFKKVITGNRRFSEEPLLDGEFENVMRYRFLDY